MKKIIFIIIPSIILALIVFLLFQYFLNRTSEKGALQVTSDPKSKVYLNGKYVGDTPLCLCGTQDPGTKNINKEMMAIGEYVIKLEPQTGTTPFEEKITIAKSVLTVVDRKFSQSAQSEGSVISLTPLENKESIELQVLTFPVGADISLDSSSVGSGPVHLKTDVTESDHALLITKDGYKEKTVRIRTPKGYRLTAIVYLGIDIVQADEKKEDKKASPAASLTPIVKKRVQIGQTPNGFLRVRKSASISGAEVTRVNSGEEFEVIEESPGWYKIKLPTGEEGWVSEQFSSLVDKN